MNLNEKTPSFEYLRIYSKMFVGDNYKAKPPSTPTVQRCATSMEITHYSNQGNYEVVCLELWNFSENQVNRFFH